MGSEFELEKQRPCVPDTTHREIWRMIASGAISADITAGTLTQTARLELPASFATGAIFGGFFTLSSPQEQHQTFWTAKTRTAVTSVLHSPHWLQPQSG